MEVFRMTSNRKSNSKNINYLDKFIALQNATVIIAMICIVIAMTITVLCRYIIKGAVLGLEDISMLSGIWMYFIGASIVTYEETHISGGVLNFITQNKLVKEWIGLTTRMLSMFLLIYLGVKAYQYCYSIYDADIRTGGILLPKIYMVSSVFVGAILMTFNIFLNLVRSIKQVKSFRS